MSILYITQDTVGIPTGGGLVTGFEREVLASLGDELFRMDNTVVPVSDDPFANDERYCASVKQYVSDRGAPRLAHFYAGCFTLTAGFLKSKGAKISYTVDAHDPDLSIDEYARFGAPYVYRHMSDRNLRAIYVKGYTLADVVIVPSAHSEKVMRALGCSNIVTIPHPVRPFQDLPLPKSFAVGYFGQIGPDKGTPYLLEAWKSLDPKEFSLIFAGDNIQNMMYLWHRKGGRNIELMGRVDKAEDFYKRISVYVQPSVTEGFGIPILEAMACGRPVIVAEGAGAVDILNAAPSQAGIRVPIRDPKAIAEAIRFYMDHPDKIREHGQQARAHSSTCAPEIIRNRYLSVWRAM